MSGLMKMAQATPGDPSIWQDLGILLRPAHDPRPIHSSPPS